MALMLLSQDHPQQLCVFDKILIAGGIMALHLSTNAVVMERCLTSCMSDPMMAISIMIHSTYLGIVGYTFLHAQSTACQICDLPLSRRQRVHYIKRVSGATLVLCTPGPSFHECP